ncbi:MAG: tyrosine-type recombinase/integrase [Panacagrimonas sp.]
MRITKPLTDTDCRALKPDPTGDKRTRIYDGGGLFLEALPNGRKLWRLKYVAAGRETKATFGEYPVVTLKKARDKRDEARGVLADGLDVNEHKARVEAADVATTAAGSFEAVARAWYAAEIEGLSETYKVSVTRLLERDVLPFIGRRPLRDLTPRELLDVFRRVNERGAEETARRARVMVGQVIRYAIRNDMADTDPTLALRGEKRKTAKRHFAAFTDPADVARLMTAIYCYRGTPEVRALLKLSAMLFQRPGEIRRMQWSEIDLKAAQWRYRVTKTNSQHLVPLSAQAIEVLRDLQPLTDHGLSLQADAYRYVFPSPRSRLRPASENAARQALRNMGFTNDEMTAHGFRAMARSLLAELGWKPDAIERQLAHKASGPLGAAYDRASFLDERNKMMQAWADYLDRLRTRSNVASLRAA